MRLVRLDEPFELPELYLICFTVLDNHYGKVMQIWKNRIPKGSADEIQSNSSLIQGEYSSSNNITNLETEAWKKKLNAETNLNIITRVYHWTRASAFVFQDRIRIINFGTALIKIYFCLVTYNVDYNLM